MPKRKRESPPTLRLLLPDGEGDALEAEEAAVRLISECAAGLPAGAELWDLTGFTLDGQQVKRRTVVRWLNAVYQTIYAEDFDAELEPDNSVSGFVELLAFADAVGTTYGGLRTITSSENLDGLKLHISLGDQQLELTTDGTSYTAHRKNDVLRLYSGTLHQKSTEVAFGFDDAQLDTLRQQAAVQVEELLYYGYRMQLKQVLDRVLQFVRMNTLFWQSVFPSKGGIAGSTLLCNHVLTKRVVQAALGSNILGKDALARELTGTLVTFSNDRPSPAAVVLEPINLPEYQMQPLEFSAVLKQDLMGTPKGTVVAVKLDLFGRSVLRIGDHPIGVRLRLGPA